MCGVARSPGPAGRASCSPQLRLGNDDGGLTLFGRRRGYLANKLLGRDQPILKLRDDYEWRRLTFRLFLTQHGLGSLWEVIEKHGRPLISMPFELGDRDDPVQVAARQRLQKTPFGPSREGTLAPSPNAPAPDPLGPHLMFELPPTSTLLKDDPESAKVVASLLGVDPYALHGWAVHLVYRNDGRGPMPFNLGTGSDQGATAYLGLFLTRHEEGKGLRRLGINVIDVRTPRGYLADGDPQSNASHYHTVLAPYQGLSSIEFEVRVSQARQASVDVFVRAGVDSVRWGKLVQNLIHEHVSNSPIFPWPKEPEKFYAQAGVVAKVTPKWLQSQNEFAGLKYRGQIEFQGKFETGTHATELTVGARYNVRTAWFQIGGHQVHLDMDVLSVDARAFIRNNQGQERHFKGAELGLGTKIMARMGRVGIGVAGDVLYSQDPSFQTGNPSGSSPVFNPHPQIIGGDPTGGGAGHHGSGMLLFEYRFGKGGSR